MEIDTGTEQPQKKISKKLIGIIVAAIVLIGGTVSAFFIFNASPKEQYFLAEKKSAEFITEQFKERFKSELEWTEHTRENPIEENITLSAEYNDPHQIFGDVATQQMINNSSIAVKSSSDLKNKVMAGEFQANIGDVELSELEIHLTSDKVAFGMPFLDEIIQIDETSLNELLHEMDPYEFPDENTITFDAIFEQVSGTAFQEFVEHLKEEYGQLLYDELPKEAFTSEKENITVDNEEIKANKIAMHLSEEEAKSLLHTFFDKMQNDEKIKEIIEEQVSAQFGLQNAEISEAIQEFEDGLQAAKDNLENDFHLPNGLTSTIWTKGDLIVQRDFSMELGPSENELAGISLNGTQKLEADNQSFDYEVDFSDSGIENTLKINGDFTQEKDETTDSLTFAIEGGELSYNGTETLDGKTKDFDREISLNFNLGFQNIGGSLIWAGNATYDNDKMDAEHNLSLDIEGLDPNMFSLLIKSDAKTVDKVELPEKPIKDIGEMSVDELDNYFEKDILPQFEEWMFNTFGGFLGEF